MKKERLLWSDLLRILAIYAVIVIHTVAPLLVEYDTIGFDVWWIANIYDSLTKWCIPVFFMLSGAFLIEKATIESPATFFLKRLQKILIPFIIWSALYFAWRIHFNDEQLYWKDFITLLLREPVYYHLWFIYILIGLYLLAPVLGVYVKGAGSENLVWFLLLWYIFGSVLPMLQNCCNIHTYLSIGETETVFNYVGYFLLGYLLRNIQLRLIQIVFFLFLFSTGAISTVYWTYIFSFKVNGATFDSTFYDYYSVNVLAMSISFFLLVKSMLLSAVSGRISTSVASCVPGIYFIHALVIAILKRGLLGFIFTDRQFPVLTGIPIFSLVVFAISYALILIIKIIPGLKYTVP